MIFNHQATKPPRGETGFEPVSRPLDALAREVVDAAFKVHFILGPGLLINFNVPKIKDGIRRMVL